MDGFHRFIVRIFIGFYPCSIYGLENIPDGRAIFACNHISSIDPGFIARAYDKDSFFLAKKELFKNKLFAGVLKRFGAIPIDRKNPELKTLMSVIRLLKDGHKLIIFPEGTRNKKGEVDLLELKNGTAFFAVKSKSPIIPVYLYKKPRIFRRTYMIIGKPFEFSDYYDKKITEEDEVVMNNRLREEMLNQRKILCEIVENLKKKKKK